MAKFGAGSRRSRTPGKPRRSGVLPGRLDHSAARMVWGRCIPAPPFRCFASVRKAGMPCPRQLLALPPVRCMGADHLVAGRSCRGNAPPQRKASFVEPEVGHARAAEPVACARSSRCGTRTASAQMRGRQAMGVKGAAAFSSSGRAWIILEGARQDHASTSSQTPDQPGIGVPDRDMPAVARLSQKIAAPDLRPKRSGGLSMIPPPSRPAIFPPPRAFSAERFQLGSVWIRSAAPPFTEQKRAQTRGRRGRGSHNETLA